jgi:plasmid stabilization system protein ParE
MDRKVIWADAAIADLEAAAEFISKDSPAYAAAFVHRSLESARS